MENYLELIRKSKELCTIPIIASINCYRADTWIEFAKQLQDAGADAIELNVFFLETDIHHSCEDLYQLYTQILKKVKQVVTIPVIIKLGKYISNMPALVNQLKANGADGVWHDTFPIGDDENMKTYSIDNIITSSNIEITNVNYVKTDLSDHTMMYADLILK